MTAKEMMRLNTHVASVVNKYPELHFRTLDVDAMAVTETWPQSGWEIKN